MSRLSAGQRIYVEKAEDDSKGIVNTRGVSDRIRERVAWWDSQVSSAHTTTAGRMGELPPAPEALWRFDTKGRVR